MNDSQFRKWLDKVGDEFEKKLHNGEAPPIEDFLKAELPRHPGADQQRALFRYLLALEMEAFPCWAGDRTLVLGDYVKRFPEREPDVLSIYQKVMAEAAFTPPSLSDPARLLGDRFEGVVEVGKGSFGIVYRAHHPGLQRDVAIKALKPELWGSQQDKEKFLEEARKAVNLSHPGLVTVRDIIDVDGACFIVMDYVDGVKLNKWVERRRRELLGTTDLLVEVRNLLAKVADVLSYLHSKQIVHRDLKPANILVAGNGDPYVIDLGLALRRKARQAHTGQFAGSRPYMAPEQVTGNVGRLDGRSDIWALGVILYELTVGFRPFVGDSNAEVEGQILGSDPWPPRQLAPDLPVEIEAICLKCLNKVMEDRYSTAAEFAKALRAWTPARVEKRGTEERVPPSPRVYLSRLPVPQSCHFVGRRSELATLDEAWTKGAWKIFCLLAIGGQGKTTLIREWLERLRLTAWGGAELVFAWSFSGQGKEQGGSGSAEAFIEECFRRFSELEPSVGTAERAPQPPVSPRGANSVSKGEDLAALVGRHRALVILDGLEAVQLPDGGERAALSDPALKAFLEGLAGQNRALCVITTRLAVRDLFGNKTAVKEHTLPDLPPAEGAELLKKLGVEGSPEDRQRLSEEVRGHCLALNLLGNYCRTARGGQPHDLAREMVRKALRSEYEQIRFLLRKYDNWLKKQCELQQILRLLGLFDQPAPMKLIEILKDAAVRGLTDSLAKLDGEALSKAISYLQEELGLVTKDASSLDAHPLVRAYFREELQHESPAAWRKGHSRLYDHLTGVGTSEQPTLTELQPVYEAVAHGCLAGRYRDALEVFKRRIRQGDQHYSLFCLGAVKSDLAALAYFFDDGDWQRPKKALGRDDRAYVLNEVGSAYRILGKPEVGAPLIEKALSLRLQAKDWLNASRSARNLAKTHLQSGRLKEAVSVAEVALQRLLRPDGVQNPAHDRVSPFGWLRRLMAGSVRVFRPLPRPMALKDLLTNQYISEATLGRAFHCQGDFVQAREHFRKAEALREGVQSRFTLQEAHHCDFLVEQGAAAEAWQLLVKVQPPTDDGNDVLNRGLYLFSRAKVVLARDGRPEEQRLQNAVQDLDGAIKRLRDAGRQDELGAAHLALAAVQRLLGQEQRAREQLAAARRISDRGGIRTLLGDYHLEACRLDLEAGQLAAASDHCKEAESLIQAMGYGRRAAEAKELRQRIEVGR
jgi:tetratricopeptide (TPR) repeat protein/predicted Ser/Thr protein kinase